MQGLGNFDGIASGINTTELINAILTAERAPARLLEARGDGAMAHLLAELKNKLGLRVFAEGLPFRYVQEEPA